MDARLDRPEGSLRAGRDFLLRHPIKESQLDARPLFRLDLRERMPNSRPFDCIYCFLLRIVGARQLDQRLYFGRLWLRPYPSPA